MIVIIFRSWHNPGTKWVQLGPCSLLSTFPHFPIWFHHSSTLKCSGGMMTKLKLTVNETKTRVAKLPEEKFDFLGYTFGRCYSMKTGRSYLGTAPSTTRVIRI